jgi:hypothetical protein
VCSLICIGRTPRCAREVQETGRVRMDRITELIRGSVYSISDLSRLTGGTKREPRLNMAFETGIIYGLSHSTPSKYQWFLLESQKHRLNRTLSDLNGHDPKIHADRPDRVIRIVIDWFRPITAGYRLPSPLQVVGVYKELLSRLPRLSRDECGYPACEVLIGAVIEIGRTRGILPLTRLNSLDN